MTEVFPQHVWQLSPLWHPPCLIVFIRLPPQATGWQLRSGYKKTKRKSTATALCQAGTAATPSSPPDTQSTEDDWATVSGDGRKGIYRHIVRVCVCGGGGVIELQAGSPFVLWTASLVNCHVILHQLLEGKECGNLTSNQSDYNTWQCRRMLTALLCCFVEEELHRESEFIGCDCFLGHGRQTGGL